MTFDYMPYISKIGEKYPDCYIITGFNKWGMANAVMSSNLICDLVQKKENEYEKLFSLNRKAISKNKKSFATNMLEASKNLVKSLFHIPLKSYKKLNRGEGGTYIIKGKKYGVYKDDDGIIHKVKSRCSHLKCELAFNKETKTFDCPCHGSRFTIDGEIINEPAKKSIKID